MTEIQLEEVTCIRCGKTACYVDSSYAEDVAYHLYCEKCVSITPKPNDKVESKST